MFYHNDRASILKGLYLDEPELFIPWNIREKNFASIFDGHKNHAVSSVGRKSYRVRNVTVFGEPHCNLGVTFKNRICEIGIVRDICEEDNSLKDKSIKAPEDFQNYLKESFKAFQDALEKSLGKPTVREQGVDAPNFESCEWIIGNRISISHYIMDRFGLAEYLYIEKSGWFFK